MPFAEHDTFAGMAITKLLTHSPVASTEHGDVLLELSYLMAAADGRLADAELAAYKLIVASVRGAAPSEADVSALLERFGGTLEKGEIEERVRTIAKTLPADLREVAFKLAIGLALVDDEAHDAENQLVGVLYEALDLAEDRADALAAEVRSAFA
jgi:Tellurite resistance protein TerB